MYWQNITRESWENEDITLSTKRNADLIRLAERARNPKSPIKYRVYFDMDGVVAIFNKNAPMEEVFAPGYFAKLDPIKGGVELAKILAKDERFDVNICSKSSYQAIKEKRCWLMRFLPEIDDEHIFFVPLEANKSDYIIDQTNAIIFDDYNVNLAEWKGIPFKFLNGINSYNSEYTCIDSNNPVHENVSIILDTLELIEDRNYSDREYYFKQKLSITGSFLFHYLYIKRKDYLYYEI